MLTPKVARDDKPLAALSFLELQLPKIWNPQVMSLYEVGDEEVG